MTHQVWLYNEEHDTYETLGNYIMRVFPPKEQKMFKQGDKVYVSAHDFPVGTVGVVTLVDFVEEAYKVKIDGGLFWFNHEELSTAPSTTVTEDDIDDFFEEDVPTSVLILEAELAEREADLIHLCNYIKELEEENNTLLSIIKKISEGRI